MLYLIQSDFVKINLNKINLNKNDLGKNGGNLYVYWQRKRTCFLKRILRKRWNWNDGYIS